MLSQLTIANEFSWGDNVKSITKRIIKSFSSKITTVHLKSHSVCTALFRSLVEMVHHFASEATAPVRWGYGQTEARHVVAGIPTSKHAISQHIFSAYSDPVLVATSFAKKGDLLRRFCVETMRVKEFSIAICMKHLKKSSQRGPVLIAYCYEAHFLANDARH